MDECKPLPRSFLTRFFFSLICLRDFTFFSPAIACESKRENSTNKG